MPPAPSNPHRDLQDAWTRNGAESFSFEALERLESEADPYILRARLKERSGHWRSALDAFAV